MKLNTTQIKVIPNGSASGITNIQLTFPIFAPPPTQRYGTPLCSLPYGEVPTKVSAAEPVKSAAILLITNTQHTPKPPIYPQNLISLFCFSIIGSYICGTFLTTTNRNFLIARGHNFKT